MIRHISLEKWIDNSMGNNIIRFKYKFEGFSFRESRLVSEKAIRLAGQLADELEQNLKDIDKYE